MSPHLEDIGLNCCQQENPGLYLCQGPVTAAHMFTPDTTCVSSTHLSAETPAYKGHKGSHETKIEENPQKISLIDYHIGNFCNFYDFIFLVEFLKLFQKVSLQPWNI